MVTIDDIEEAISEAIAILDKKIDDAASLRNSGFPKMDPIVDRLIKLRTSMQVKGYAGSLTTPAMMAALEAIKAATANMRTAADDLTSAEQFIANFHRLESAANVAILAAELPGEGGSRPTKPLK